MSIINGCDDVKTILRVGRGFGGDTEICFPVPVMRRFGDPVIVFLGTMNLEKGYIGPGCK